MANHAETVAAIYQAFGQGDIPRVLEYLSEDVRWEHWSAGNYAQQAKVPWLLPRQGKAGALEFFKVIGEFKFKEFQVLSLLAGSDKVVAEISIEVESPSTGAQVRDEELHLWTFDQSGKVSAFRHYVDTAKHIAAAQHKA
jgi:ketosteroid isomerase-like protein